MPRMGNYWLSVHRKSQKGWMVVITPTDLKEDLSQFVKGDKATELPKNDLKEVDKRSVT